ncbi:MAG: SDR family oxidoreductase [Acidobacteriota bacterium]
MTPSSSNTLKHKRCLVTGGTRGIGRAIAHMLLCEGAQVAICGRTQETVQQAVLELQDETGTKVHGKAADLRHYKQVEELFQFVDVCFAGSGEPESRRGSTLDVLINNAGVGVFAPIGELAVEAWQETLETNLYGTFYASKLAVSRFHGSGHIVNISSLAGAHAFAGGAAYNASKFGLIGLTEAMMQDLRSQGVRVGYVMPGSVATEFGGSTAESGSHWKIWPEDVAAVVRMMLEMPERTLVSRVEVRPARPKSEVK